MHDVDGQPRLIGGLCSACDRRSFPDRDDLPVVWCGQRSASVDLAATGSLWGWTAVTAPPPGYDGEVPFGFGVVELDDELRVITRLTESDPTALTFGQRMHLVTDVVAHDDDGTDGCHVGVRAGRPLMADVHIAGVGLHPFGRFDDRTTTDMGAIAVRAALEEAEIHDRNGFQATFCGTAYGGVAAAHKVLGRLSLTGGPIVDVEAGCASGAAALMLGAAAIRAGQYDTVLVFGIEKMPKGIIRSSFFEPWREQAGLAATPAYFALRAQRLMRESELTKHDLATVVVKNREHGVHNPNAMFRKAVTADDVLASRVVCEPLHLWMLCSPNEGAAAVVLRSVPSTRSVRLRAAVLRSHLPGNVLDESTPLSGLVDDGVPSATTRCGRRGLCRGRRRAGRPRPRRVPGHRCGTRAAGLRRAAPVRRPVAAASCSPTALRSTADGCR